ncbi:helix-turn-helix domain-containing protein [Frondihabitans australicus]|uniref:Helix-turn-helix protein n=1 Tax=Frondihabitans australicus TaxID=386892 RepID=A0A495IHX5_9MICO|nr:helix-turn-helix transcriptional regulator [Frondihabitans australicus]RKR74715.1 helix-turn-helix protein [Frondihabitans australicus]
MPGPTSDASRVLGERIRDERLRLGLSQDDIANLAGMNVSNYGKIERGIGNPVLITIVRLAVVLGVDPGSLVAGIGAEHLPDGQETYTAADFVRERRSRGTLRS